MASAEIGDLLLHWISTHQLPVETILKHITWQEAVQLASTCKVLRQEVAWMVTLTPPDREAALDPKTPDRLRIPLLTGLTSDDARAYNNEALRVACKHGHLEVAQWLTDRFQLTADDARAYNNEALRVACKHGYLEVAQWLTDWFQLTTADARADDNGALRWSCGNGHLEVAQWLTDRFQLTADDARAWQIEALREACGNGHLEVAQ
jgi:hypothetical protein